MFSAAVFFDETEPNLSVIALLKSSGKFFISIPNALLAISIFFSKKGKVVLKTSLIISPSGKSSNLIVFLSFTKVNFPLSVL